jgi:hypothetical protein
VLLPTIQVQETLPAPSEVLAPRPWALDGPDLYSTRIEHTVLGEVLTISVVDCPCRTDSGPFTKLTPAAWAGWTVAVGVASDPPPTPSDEAGEVSGGFVAAVPPQAAVESSSTPSAHAAKVFRRSLPKAPNASSLFRAASRAKPVLGPASLSMTND